MVGGQQADGEGRDAHRQQRADQGGLAADPIAKVAEEHRADRTGHECQAEGGQRGQQSGGRIALGEEQERKHRHRRGGIDIEIVKLDGGAHH